MEKFKCKWSGKLSRGSRVPLQEGYLLKPR